jgi:hypothetical protein
MKKFLLVILCTLFINQIIFAADFEDLCKDGYAVILKTNITGDFDGCDYDKYYKLDNGMTFRCNSYHYHYSYHPEFFVLKNINYGDYKYIIDNDEYRGTLYK